MTTTINPECKPSRFQITIVEHAEEINWKDREWEQGTDPENPENFGYTPEVKVHEVIKRMIYKQNVSEFDLVAVIKTVNGI